MLIRNNLFYSNFELQNAKNYIVKPFTPQVLNEKLAAVLGV